MDRQLINLSQPHLKQKLHDHIQNLEGIHWVEIKRYAKGRTLSSNRYYWGCVLPAAARGFYDAWGERLDVDAVHDFFKRRYLTRPVIDKETGELKGHVSGSTTDLTTEQFSAYIDMIIRFCAEYLEVEVPLPDSFAVGRAYELESQGVEP